MDGSLREQFLERVEVRHGAAMREACAQFLPEPGEAFNPLAILKLAEEKVYPDQIAAVAAMNVRCFDSDGDL